MIFGYLQQSNLREPFISSNFALKHVLSWYCALRLFSNACVSVQYPRQHVEGRSQGLNDAWWDLLVSLVPVHARKPYKGVFLAGSLVTCSETNQSMHEILKPVAIEPCTEIFFDMHATWDLNCWKKLKLFRSLTSGWAIYRRQGHPCWLKIPYLQPSKAWLQESSFFLYNSTPPALPITSSSMPS